MLKLAFRMMVESPLGTALEDLERLIDEQTPYFKGRIEELPPQSRRVFHCLAQGWRPLLAKEVAAASKLSSSHASAQLRQLVEKGYAKEHRLPNNKRAYYEVVDRFYNIYYLLRLSHESRDRFKQLLQFLQGLFGVVGMRTSYEAALSELRGGAAEKDKLISVLAEHVAGDEVRWEESLTHLAKAADRPATDPAFAGELAHSFIGALAAGHASRVKEIMANAALAESMEPLWHATCVELGEEVGPLPAEIVDAVAAVRAEIETSRAANSPTGRTVSGPRAGRPPP